MLEDSQKLSPREVQRHTRLIDAHEKTAATSFLSQIIVLLSPDHGTELGCAF